MIYFFQKNSKSYIAVGTDAKLDEKELEILRWLFSDAAYLTKKSIEGDFIGPRKEMISPWSTNAVEITQNCGISGIFRIEEFFLKGEMPFDPMLEQQYENLDQNIYTLKAKPAPIRKIEDLKAFNLSEGLALSGEEIDFLAQVSHDIGRPLTDSEVFGFSQINSEHCRHKIFNGSFVIDDEVQQMSLFQWIKKTSKDNPNFIVSAYKDNVAFIQGPVAEQFAPSRQDKPDFFKTDDFESVISLKAETHNFPTTVEPFNGAATGSGGEIRDRLAGGQGSFPLAGTAVYMTSYPRLEDTRTYEENVQEREWLYQTPKEILIKASNGASDFGNKYGQPLICGSLLTFEHAEGDLVYGFDKVIMLAGGIGFAKLNAAIKKPVQKNEQVIILGGDNYRIGMGGGAVSSVATGEYENTIELNAVQRSNPEMQKRVANAIRAMAEADINPIVSIHDHGAGGHLNCLSELVEEAGGRFDLKRFPIGDPTLSDMEVLSNESQERMGLVIAEEDKKYLQDVAERERAPYYEVGKTTDDNRLVFQNNGQASFDLRLQHLFGSSPKTVLEDKTVAKVFEELSIDPSKIEQQIESVLKLEAVACKDWLTNKVDRSVTGKVATQQTTGEIQVPLNNVSVMSLDYKSRKGVATSIGHSPVSGLIDAGAGSRLSVTEALTNLVFTPLTHGLKGVSLSANWMWPAKNEGENSRLYEAVRGLSEFCTELGINVPTGKDSLSMTQKYPDGSMIFSPGTVIVSTVGEVEDIRKTISPDVDTELTDSEILYIDFSGHNFELGGSAFAQTNSKLGRYTPDASASVVGQAFEVVQQLVRTEKIAAGHDVSSGGLITTLLEMNFPNINGGMEVDLTALADNAVNVLFSEKPGIVIQPKDHSARTILEQNQISYSVLGHMISDRNLKIQHHDLKLDLDIDKMRKVWMTSSHLLDQAQTEQHLAKLRFDNYHQQPLEYTFPKSFVGSFEAYGIDLERKSDTGVKAAIIREKGVNGDREMAYSLWMAGFDVKDVHMTDLVTGREDLSDVNMIVFVGGFSNSDVLGSAKGWAGSFIFNEKAQLALERFYERNDTLSLGVCNGCQLMMELDRVYPEMSQHPKMHDNATGKFESAFVNVDILPNETVMFNSMVGARLGIWLAHGEGRFVLTGQESDYIIPVKYSYSEFPGNPNGSDFATAALASRDGRHVAIMPHLERSIFPWNWPHYKDKLAHEVSPWIEPFVNAKNWIQSKLKD